MATAPEIVEIACEVKPDEATLVPERRQELTTEGGLDVVVNQEKVAQTIRSLTTAGIEISLFIDPDIRQIETAKLLGVKAVELQTARYSEVRTASDRQRRAGSSARSRRFRPRTGAARSHGARAELHECPTRDPVTGSGGVKHRPQHHRTGHSCRHGASGARDESCSSRRGRGVSPLIVFQTVMR